MDSIQYWNEMYAAACEQRRPFIQLRPRLFVDGNQWCALYGDNMQDGVAGFGESPELASWNFDKVFCEKLPNVDTRPDKVCPVCKKANCHFDREECPGA